MAWTLLFAIPLFLMPVGYFLWLRSIYARPPVTGAAVVAEYDPPADLSPIEAALLLDGTLKPHALAAAIVGLYMKGAIEIAEEGGMIVALRRVQTDVALALHEKIILTALFSYDETVTAKLAADRIGSVAGLIKTAVVTELRKRGFIAERSLSAPILFVSAAMSALIISLSVMPFFGLPAAVAILASLVLMAQFAYIAGTWRPRLTGRGKEATLRLMGFKLWFTQVEGDYAAWIEKEEKRITAYTPYAIVFGVSLTWATKLQTITAALLKNIL